MAFIHDRSENLMQLTEDIPVEVKTCHDFSKERLRKLTKAERAELKQKYGGRCAYCGELLGDKWHADHIEPVQRNLKLVKLPPGSGFTHRLVTDGTAWRPERHQIDNMNPSCISCNLFKGGYDVEGFRFELSEQVDRARKGSVNFRMAERFGQIIVTEHPIVFWFEKYTK